MKKIIKYSKVEKKQEKKEKNTHYKAHYKTFLIIMMFCIAGFLLVSAINFVGYTKYERFETGSDAEYSNLGQTRWMCQQFLIGNTGTNETIILKGVSVYLSKTGTPTKNINITLTSHDAGGNPLFNNLSSGTLAHTDIDTTLKWVNFSMTTYTINASSNLSLCLWNDAGVFDAENTYQGAWNSTGSYTGGIYLYSPDTGSTWTKNVNADLLFKLYGSVVTGSITTTLNSPTNGLFLTTDSYLFNTSYSTNSFNITNATFYIYNSTGLFNRTSYGNNGALNYTVKNFSGLAVGSYTWNALVCGINSTNTYCNFANSNYTFTSGININSVNYSYTTILTETATFKINITSKSTVIPIIYLVYNGTPILTSLSGNQYVVNISPTITGNISFYWNINYASSTVNTSNYYQLVYSLTSMNITSGPCTTGLTEVMNFSFADEGNLTPLLNMNVKYNFKYGITNYTGSTLYGTTNASRLSVCLNTSASPTYYIGYGEIEYSKTSYSSRRFYVFEGTRVSNVTIQNTLYSLLSADSTSFSLEVRKPTLTPYSDKYLSLLRWYPDLDQYKIVEMGITDDKGQIVQKVKIEDVDYRIGLYNKDGTLIYLANPLRMVCLTSPCSYTITVPDTAKNTFTEVSNIETSLTYDSTTKIFTLVYNDPSENTDTMQLLVHRISGTSDTIVCSQNSTAFTGIITCDVSAQNGLLKAEVFRSASPWTVLSSLIIDTGTSIFQGTFGLFLQFLITVTLIFLGIVNPITSIILGILSLVLGVLLFKTITYPIFIGIAVLGGIVIHFMRRSNA